MMDLQQYRTQMLRLAIQLKQVKDEAIALAASVEKDAKKSSDGVAMAKVYIGLRHVFDMDKTTHKAFITHHETWKKVKMPQLFDDIGVTNIPVASFGARVQVSTKSRCSVRAAKKDEAFAWLRDKGYADNIYEAIHHDTLNNIATEFVSEHGEDMPEELFSVFDEPNTSAVKIKET